MFGTVRGIFTLVGAGTAGLLIWLATQIGQGTTSGYWEAMGVVAGAGLVMALAQLFGGWTKWGVPRISAGVFLIGFLPVLFVAGWVLLAGQPDANWFQQHTTSWSGSLSIDGLVDDLRTMLPVLAFGVGLVFGFTFDTSGPKQAGEPLWEASAPVEEPQVSDTEVSDTGTEPSEAVTTVDTHERVPSAQG